MIQNKYQYISYRIYFYNKFIKDINANTIYYKIDQTWARLTQNGYPSCILLWTDRVVLEITYIVIHLSQHIPLRAL